MNYVIGNDVILSSGLLTATVASRIHRAAQPALLYLVPFTLLPLLTMAYLKVRDGMGQQQSLIYKRLKFSCGTFCHILQFS